MTAPLRIAIPIHSFEPGGVERVALNLAEHWQQTGHQVTIVLGRDEGLDRGRASASLAYRTRASRVPTARFETAWMIWCLFLFLSREQVDVIFCPGNTYAVVCVAMRLLMGENCPPIVSKISNDLVRRDKSALRRRLYHAWLRVQGMVFDRFVALAEPMHGEIVNAMGVGAHRVSIIHDPAMTKARFDRLAAIPRLQVNRGSYRFLALSRLVPQKNLDAMLRAFAVGSQPGDKLTIVGDGPEREQLELLVRRFAIENHVRFVGHVTDPDPHLRDADCLLLSSNYEGVPAVMLEAIAAGLQIIATDCSSSMQALAGHGARATLVPVRDIDAMAHEISRVDQVPRPGPAQRDYAARFTVEAAAGTYIAVMRRSVASARQVRLLMSSPPAR
ncbi:glycosyltransferase [Novosphingobium sp. P6W]|uniref:glycosyltransferase n=1 Tax=Novosphingobium sp. P6W TaxID=1609758 RepID=UPI0005C32381|nr:glycosyltransferase [Novosphingobium sp. P6W]AXB76555.1 glycosyltransferase [Novosphingobium sp. P6W]KIS30801.1 group 1 glycosyl transferase [Novosphingobium sp. P6W]